MKFTIIKSCLACFSGIFALGTPSNIHSTATSYRCTKFGAFVNFVTTLTLRDLTIVPVYKTVIKLQTDGFCKIFRCDFLDWFGTLVQQTKLKICHYGWGI